MIKSITKLPQESEEEIAIKNLIENFNNESKRQNLKYRIELEYNFPHLTKPLFWIIGNSLGNHQINYHNKTFSFIKGIDNKTFEDIKIILNNLNEEFIIELID